MRLVVPRRHRLPLLWAAFTVAAAATAFAVHRLYETARREIAEQTERALEQERTWAREHVRATIEGVRRSAIVDLAGFHVDGLGYALRQWDESNQVIVGTFQWEPGRGFLAGSVVPAAAGEADAVAELWRAFREWRAAHPSASACEPAGAGPYHAVCLRTIDSPSFPAGEARYQEENLELLADAGGPVDPWAGWAGRRDDARAPWAVWYQAGPDAPVRGCFVSVEPILERLRGELAARRLARLSLMERAAAAEAVDDSLPAVALLAEPGEAFLEKQSAARLSALAAALLFGLFLLGVAGLAAASRRDARDAERKATFVSQVSHELRTPLTSIRMFADMLGNPALPQEKRLRFAGTISRESRRLGALIERLLAFAALEKGRHPVVLEVVDVADLARETMEEAEVSLGASGLRIEAGWPEEPALARTDRSMVKQALLDLLDNAAKYASGGGVVRLGLSVDGAWLRLRVADRGPGIPAAVRSRLFEPFVQGDRTLTDASSGVGLGLSIARGLLRAAGGDLVLLPSSEGATFEIRLPAARLSAPRDGATAGPAEDVSPSNLSRTP